MTQQRRVKPAVGVAAVGLGIGAGALGLYSGPAKADPPHPTWAAPATADKLMADGRALLKDGKLGEALAKADAAARAGAGPAADALRKDVRADGHTQIDELTAQAKTLAGRGDAERAKASLELARQLAAEVGLATAPPAAAPEPSPVVPAVAVALPAQPGAVQTVAFHPADPLVLPPLPAPPATAPTLPPPLSLSPVEPAKPQVPELKVPASDSLPALPPTKPELAPAPTAKPDLPPALPLPKPAATPTSGGSSAPLLPPPPALTLTPGGPAAPPALPGGSPPTPGDAPVKLPKIATAAVGAALAAAPLPAQDAVPKPAPAPAEQVSAPMAAPPAVSRDQFDALKADLDGLKDYKRQVQDLLQGKADGASKSVLDAGVLKRLADLEDKLDRLDKAVESLRAGGGKADQSRVAMAPPPAPAGPPKPKVKLVNDYPTELSIILNGTSHRLKAGETKAVEVTAGSFVYELIAEGATPITRTIRDDETVTLRIK